jgi:alkanesulfonate monooxygenase SsuD/methylene tetrahydromethanopterin reductase-like flavin-dependent oxidoreductase (luciferase family)
VNFGIQAVPNRPWEELTSQWQTAEALGFDSVWIPDHFISVFHRERPFMEAWTLLAALATLTSRIRIGVLVSCNTFRHPALLAKEAVTVDHVSHGRLELGIGAGWVEAEHLMFGLRYPASPERVGMFGEAIQIIDSLLRNDVTTFTGSHYHLSDAPFRPRPVQQPRPPLTLAAHRTKMLQIVAAYADRWSSMGSPVEMRERGERLDEACLAIGRNPAPIVRSLLYVPAIMTDERPWDSLDAFADFAGRFADAGVTELLLQPPADGDWTIVERIATELIPNLRTAFA